MTVGITDFSQIARGGQNVQKSPVAQSERGAVESKKSFFNSDLKGNLAGTGIGLAVPAYTLYDSFKKLTPADAKETADIFKEFMPEADTLKRTKEVAGKTLEESGLKAKGVKINFIEQTEESLNHLKEIINTEASSTNAFGRRLGSNYYETFKQGANAAFFPNANEVVVNSKNLYSTVYHELGHAMNKNGNWFTKGLQKARNITPFGVSLLAPVFLAVGLLHKVDKTKPQEEKGKLEKTLDFISDNAGKLTLATYIPMLAEEGLASVRGLKAASKHLPKDVIGKLGGNYLKAWSTYALIAAAVSGGVALGIHVANNIKNKKSA